MNRKTCICQGDIKMLFAKEGDRRLIYDMSVSDANIIKSMFEDPDDFSWEDIKHEKDEFFNEKPSMNKYLLIEYGNEIIGVFYHTHHEAVIDNVEFHIWFFGVKHTGKGLGTKVVNIMKNYISETYNINTFIMRPWIKNPAAVRTYEKCGFEIVRQFDLNLYFTDDFIAKYGNGAYNVEETVNMVATM